MKRSVHKLFTIAAAVGNAVAFAQDPAAPNPPPPQPDRDGPPRAEGRPPRPPGEGDARNDEPRRPRPDGNEQPDGRRIQGDRRERPMVNDRVRNGLPPLQAKSQPFLGVATGPLDPALAAQLGFTPGLGLIVEEVVPDGPAAKAGVQAFDVIKQINDQLVSNPAQLTALVNHFGKDADVSLLVLRKGQEQKITVKIGEHMARTSAVLRPEGFGGMPGFGAQPFGPRRDDNPGRQPRQSQDARPGRPSDELLQKVGPGAPPEVQTFQDRISTTWNTASARVMLKDANGEIEVRSENGKRTLTAKNPKGEVAFDGPIDTEEQRKAVPPEFRKMLEQVEVRSRIERRPGGPEGAIGSGGFGRAPGAPVEPKPRRGQPEVQ